MTWSDTPIDGQQSVAANKTPINNAFTYIANSMKVDHFWDNANANLDGHHQFVQMPKSESGGTPANPTIATDIDGVYYVKEKTATESPTSQFPEPFYVMNDGAQDQILQLGFRCMVQFDGRTSNGNATINYSHNATTVERTSKGLYKITFSTPLPTDNYIVSGSAVLNSASGARRAHITVDRNSTLSTVLDENFVIVAVDNASGSDSPLVDPLVGMVAICGG